LTRNSRIQEYFLQPTKRLSVNHKRRSTIFESIEIISRKSGLSLRVLFLIVTNDHDVLCCRERVLLPKRYRASGRPDIMLTNHFGGFPLKDATIHGHYIPFWAVAVEYTSDENAMRPPTESPIRAAQGVLNRTEKDNETGSQGGSM
jgi:hypothetical protein